MSPYALAPDSRSSFRAQRSPVAPDDYLVFAPGGTLCVELTDALTQMAKSTLSPLTVADYGRCGLRFFTHRHILTGTNSFDQLLPWHSPVHLRFCFRDYLIARGAKIAESTQEIDVWHVDAPPELASELSDIVCGVFHLFQGLVSAQRLSSNPFEIPFDQRKARRFPTPVLCASSATITPRFRFRIPVGAVSALRTDSAIHLPHIVPALKKFGAPSAIICMIETMIEGLARIAEQIALTVWDWWEASMFGDSIDTTNKGDGKRRMKLQVFSPGHVGEMLYFFDGERRKLDPQGWGLAEWRAFLTDETITIRVRRAQALAAPLFPSAKGTFYSRSGVVGRWYAPAMKKAGLPTRTHYIRHCGVNSYMAYVEARTDITSDQKRTDLLEFARGMGWKWPEVMLAHYSLPQRRAQALADRRIWVSKRDYHMQHLYAGLGRPSAPPLPLPQNDRQVSNLMRFAIGPEMAA